MHRERRAPGKKVVSKLGPDGKPIDDSREEGDKSGKDGVGKDGKHYKSPRLSTKRVSPKNSKGKFYDGTKSGLGLTADEMNRIKDKANELSER